MPESAPVEVSRASLCIAQPLAEMRKVALPKMEKLWAIMSDSKINPTSTFAKQVRGGKVDYVFTHEMPTFKSSNAKAVTVCTTLTMEARHGETLVTAVTTLAPVPDGDFDRAANSAGALIHLEALKSVCEGVFKLKVSEIARSDPGRQIAD